MVPTPLILLAALTVNPAELPLVTVDHDNFAIWESCRVRVAASPIADADNNGVIHILGSELTVAFEDTPLRGAEPDATPDTYRGTGIWITGKKVSVSGAVVNGFRTGIFARQVLNLVIEDCDLSDNFCQRLGSTAEREASADWLRPHDNDDHEWINNYGAGLYVEESPNIVIRRNRAWGTQNGIILTRCTGAAVYDNDCSFGSGWGLAMWRCRGNTISRNAFDFRVRGYSHGVYNRGQDSAGILLFEQCSENVITRNSATHCGDGLFAFAGREALGQTRTRHGSAWFRERGDNDNIIAGNDFSDAVAHGIEITFSFRNRVVSNRVVGAAICGLWGGYSQQTFIAGNFFKDNGGMPYGLERGAINIEHGSANVIYHNRFVNNPCGVHLWWDEDKDLADTQWANANSTAVENNSIVDNTFEADAIAVQLRKAGQTTMMGNKMIDVGVELEADEQSRAVLKRMDAFDMKPFPIDDPESPGDTNPVGARAVLTGREHIIMTEWGPYDWTRPLLHLSRREPGRDVYELLGPAAIGDARIEAGKGITIERNGSQIVVKGEGSYTLRVTAGTATLTADGVLE